LVPTVAVVDYGEQFNKLDKISEQYDDTYYFNHLIYLKNLKENTTYYYRYRALDRKGKVITSSVKSFKTKSFSDSGVIKVPDDLQQKQAPYKLACEQNKKYVLTQDIIAQTQGILLSGHNCNFDLDGHTIIYDEGKPKVISTSWSDYAYNNETTAGIKAELWNYTNYVIRNGIIKQGKNGGSGIGGTGFNPIALQHSGGLSDIQGVTLEFYGNSINGVIQTNGKIFSHNVLYDKGWAIDDRHAQIKAVSDFKTCNKQDTVCAEVAYNSLRRFRQSGFAGAEGSNIHHNELYMDSFATNSFGIGNASNSKSEYNKIFGLGYAPNGLGNGGEGCIVSNNLIYINCYAPERRTDQNGNDEYGRDSAISGIRYTNYGSNPASNQIYENNTIVLKAYNGCSQARGLWISNGTDDMNNIIRNNTIKVEAMPGNLKSGTPPDDYYNNNVNWVLSPITGTGPTDLDIFTDDGSGILTAPIYPSESNRIYNDNIPSPIIFSNNHLIGNVQLITLGEGYGILGNAWFYNTKLERINHDDSFFAPIRLGFWCWNTFGNRMVDNILLGNMTENDLTPRFLGGAGYMDIRYGVSKQISVFDENGESLKNAELHIKFPDGYFDKVTTDNNGRVNIDWLQIKQVKAGSCQDGTCGVGCGEGSGHSGTFQGTPTKIEYSELTIGTADGKLSVTYPKSYLSGSGRIDLK
jgi:hypothetical protein